MEMPRQMSLYMVDMMVLWKNETPGKNELLKSEFVMPMHSMYKS